MLRRESALYLLTVATLQLGPSYEIRNIIGSLHPDLEPDSS